VNRIFAPVSASWQRYWFSPQAVSTLALFRIAFGLLTTAWTVSLAPNLFVFYGPDGIGSFPPTGPPGLWSILFMSATWWAALTVYAATLVGALALTVSIMVQRPGRSSIGLLMILAGLPFYRFWRRSTQNDRPSS